MTHPIFSIGNDGVHASDDHKSLRLDAVQANSHGIETTPPGKSTEELTYALPLQEGFIPDTMSNAELVDKCMQEINQYHTGVLHSDTYCTELQRRAILQGDQDAWKAMQECLSDTVRGWLYRHPKGEVACRLNSEETYITLAFAHFYKAAILKQVEFSRLTSTLQYLRVSLNVVLLDTLRTFSKPLVNLFPDRKLYNSEMPTTEFKVWEMLEKMLLNMREQRLAFLLFHCGLSPKNIVHTFPEEFNDAREISLLRCKIIDQLLELVDQHNWPIDTNRRANTAKLRF